MRPFHFEGGGFAGVVQEAVSKTPTGEAGPGQRKGPGPVISGPSASLLTLPLTRFEDLKQPQDRLPAAAHIRHGQLPHKTDLARKPNRGGADHGKVGEMALIRHVGPANWRMSVKLKRGEKPVVELQATRREGHPHHQMNFSRLSAMKGRDSPHKRRPFRRPTSTGKDGCRCRRPEWCEDQARGEAT